MLVVSRRDGESVMVGDDIEIRVMRVDKNGVRLAIRAPEHVTIFRSELLEGGEPREHPNTPQVDF